MFQKLWRVWKRIVQDNCVTDPDVLDGPELVIYESLIDGLQDVQTFSHLHASHKSEPIQSDTRAECLTVHCQPDLVRPLIAG